MEVNSLLCDIQTSMRKLSGDPSWNLESEASASESTTEPSLGGSESTQVVASEVQESRKNSLPCIVNGNAAVVQNLVSPGDSITAQLGFEDRLSLLFNSTSLSFASLPSSNEHSTASLISPIGDHCSSEPVFPFERCMTAGSSAPEMWKINRLSQIRPTEAPSAEAALVPLKLETADFVEPTVISGMCSSFYRLVLVLGTIVI